VSHFKYSELSFVNKIAIYATGYQYVLSIGALNISGGKSFTLNSINTITTINIKTESTNYNSNTKIFQTLHY